MIQPLRDMSLVIDLVKLDSFRVEFLLQRVHKGLVHAVKGLNRDLVDNDTKKADKVHAKETEAAQWHIATLLVVLAKLLRLLFYILVHF
jgi:hypothetical protein